MKMVVRAVVVQRLEKIPRAISEISVQKSVLLGTLR